MNITYTLHDTSILCNACDILFTTSCLAPGLEKNVSFPGRLLFVFPADLLLFLMYFCLKCKNFPLGEWPKFLGMSFPNSPLFLFKPCLALIPHVLDRPSFKFKNSYIHKFQLLWCTPHRDVRQMWLQLIERRASDWGRSKKSPLVAPPAGVSSQGQSAPAAAAATADTTPFTVSWYDLII